MRWLLDMRIAHTTPYPCYRLLAGFDGGDAMERLAYPEGSAGTGALTIRLTVRK